MTERHSLSHSTSLYWRKYCIGPVLIIIGAYAIISYPGFLRILGLLLVAIGVFYLLLRKVAFDENSVYVLNKQFAFSDLTKLSSLEVNLYAFPYMELNDNGRKRRIWTDSGQAGILRILLGLLIPKFDPFKNIKKFKQLFDDSRI